jgi:tight adherence protein B
VTPVASLGLAFIALSIAAALLATLLERREQHALARKVDLVVGPQSPRTARESAGIIQLRTWAKQVVARPRWLFTVGASHNWGMRSGTLRLLLVGAVAAGIAWTLLRATLHMSPWISVIGSGVCFMLIPRFLLRREQRRAEARFTDLFPSAIDMLVRMVRAGLPVTAAIRTVGSEAPLPISTVFFSIADQIEIGVPLEDALATMGKRVGLSDFRFFAVAVALQRATGGNLATTLETLSEIIRKRRAVRLKARAATSEVRISAIILGSLPFLVIAAITLMTPDYLKPLISDPRGNVVAGIAITSLLLGAGVMRWIIQRGMAV